jgi:predicted RNA-binding protein YlqC (UPF0109 family)
VRDLIDYVVRSLVERPDEVHIEEHTDGDVPLFELSVHPDDRGRVIGRNGQTIRAVRSVVAAAAALRGEEVDVDVTD